LAAPARAVAAGSVAASACDVAAQIFAEVAGVALGA
jgi:lipoprotein